MPILLYRFVEPDVWPRDGNPVEKEAKVIHSQEVNRFAQSETIAKVLAGGERLGE